MNLSYLKKSFVYYPANKNQPHYNNFNRIIFSLISIISSIITLITFGFVVMTWPTDYMSYLIFKRCNEREMK